MSPPSPSRARVALGSAWTAMVSNPTVTDWAARLTALATLLGTLMPMALRRLIDGDEGYLLMAARLVSEGHRPYVDFFSTQMPGMAYAFGTWFSVLGRSWISGRVFAGLIAVATGMLLFEYVARATRSLGWSLVSVFAFAGSGYVLGWLTIAKTYGLTAMFAMAGALMLILPPRRWTWFAAGLCFALATQTRLYAIVIVLSGLLFVWQLRNWRGFAWYTFGAAAGALLVLPSVMRSTEAVWFGVIQYHGMREAGQQTLMGDFPQKWKILRGLVVPQTIEGASDLQMPLLLALAVTARVMSVSRRVAAAGFVWIPLFIVSLIPTPTYSQYFCVVVPLLLADGVSLLGQKPLRVVWAPVLILGSLYTAMGASEVSRFTTTGFGLTGVWTPDRAVRWSLTTMRKVAREIDAQGISEAASWWPGYFINTRTELVRGLVNDFGFRVADRVPAEKKALYHLVSHDDVRAMMVAQAPRLFVEGNWAATPPANLLPSLGYQLASTYANVRLWVAPPPTTSAP